MGSKPKAPTYNVEYRTTDYIPTEYGVQGMNSVAQYMPGAMQVPEYDTNAALAEQNRLNQTVGSQQYANVSGPMGGYNVSIDPVTGQMTVNKQLGENSQMAMDKQLQALGSYTGDPTQAANAYYNAQMSYLQPQMDKQIERAESSLTNRGLPIGSSAWNDAIGNVYENQNRTLSALSNEALAKGQQYQSNILNQASMLGGQVIDPSIVGGQAGAGLSDTYANQYNAQMAQAQANYDNALLRYNNMYQDEQNRYQNELNAYNAALTNNMGQYQANLSNNQGLYQNDLNKYQAALQKYQTDTANYNSNMGALAKGVGVIGGAALGSIVPGVGTLAGAQLGGMLGGMTGDVSNITSTKK